jgi:signal transduction histidine kinase
VFRPSTLANTHYPITVSLKRRLAWTIALLAFVPNLAIVGGFWLTSRQQLGDQGLLFLAWMVLVAGACGLVGYWLARALLKPLDELTRGLLYLRGSERTLSELALPSPKERPPSEIQELREGFEELLDHLRQVLESREATYAALTHDLKTPLIATKRALEYLELAGNIGPERRKELLREIQAELGRSYDLVENLLTASRLENQRPQPETLGLRAILEDFRLRYDNPAARRGVKLSIEGTGQVRADKGLLERAFMNLVENAMRHAKGQVVLRAGDGWLEVEDDGPGLQEDLDSLTRPFRSQRLHGIRAGSAGLGLYVVRRVAELHGGGLENLNGSLGGARLRLRLG